MLLRILRTHLAPYKPWLAAIVALQFTATVAMLYLPSLNADIIDKGVAVGDTDYIWHTGGVMLAVTLLQIACQVVAVACAARTSMSFGRDLRGAVFHRVGQFSGREVAQFVTGVEHRPGAGALDQPPQRGPLVDAGRT